MPALQYNVESGLKYSFRFFSFAIMFCKMKQFYRILPMVLGLILFSCNQKTFMNIDEIPLPPEAKQGTIEGRYEVELDGATSAILSEMKKNYAKTQEKVLFLPGETDAAKILEFYAAKMSEKGFTKNVNIPLQSRNYRQNVWKKDNQAVSAAVIDAGKDADRKAIKFLAIHLGEK
jgi:hypothetical protein